MLDIRLIREQPDRVRTALAARNADPAAVDALVASDVERRALTAESDTLKAQRNALSKEIPVRAKAGENIEPLKQQSRELGERIAAIDERLKGIEEREREALLMMPNIAHEDVPVGRDEHANVVARSWGTKPAFAFAPKPHHHIGAELGILDLERGVKISGSGFYVLKGAGAKLERALINWLLDTHTTRNGYTEVQVPHMVNAAALTGTTQLPKFADQLYYAPEDQLYLIPTAEVPVTNLHAEEILDGRAMPIKYVAATPCFRREAGSYGKDVHGITRVHQFNKVEMVQIVAPETSDAAHEELTGHATALLEALGLHYRVLLLSSGDMGFGAAKCYDLEVWAPGMDRYLEVSSCSNFRDFQSRRAGIRFRREPGAKPEFAHTLNGSGLALPRLVIALLECGQQADGSVLLPPVLHPYFGADRIAK